jgi:hypothetical protein
VSRAKTRNTTETRLGVKDASPRARFERLRLFFHSKESVYLQPNCLSTPTTTSARERDVRTYLRMVEE